MSPAENDTVAELSKPALRIAVFVALTLDSTSFKALVKSRRLIKIINQADAKQQ